MASSLCGDSKLSPAALQEQPPLNIQELTGDDPLLVTPNVPTDFENEVFKGQVMVILRAESSRLFEVKVQGQFKIQPGKLFIGAALPLLRLKLRWLLAGLVKVCIAYGKTKLQGMHVSLGEGNLTQQPTNTMIKTKTATTLPTTKTDSAVSNTTQQQTCTILSASTRQFITAHGLL
mmetsp:Transcript_33043/g.55657  ORF Transcript_33043/g.55657 Transcript_33043/m.55657 type:complete len:176 (+) Transcript_33043:69-596(+)